MKQLGQAGAIWMTEVKKEVIPVHRGWAPQLVRVMKGQTELFKCPSTTELVPISPMLIAQYRTGFTYPTVATDSPYFRRSPTPNAQNFYEAGFETEADVAGGDRDFNDATVYTKPVAGSNKALVYAVKGSTGRQLDLIDWRGASWPRISAPRRSSRFLCCGQLRHEPVGRVSRRQAVQRALSGLLGLVGGR